jgi:tRNA(Ile)-lysidine synthase
MRLIAHWNKGLEPDARLAVHVVTVDHKLRPESAEEADFVLREAGSVGLPAEKLSWNGPHPETGLAAAAREARYSLMSQVCHCHDAALVTAHTLDDQAETLVMALARGAGVDGLSAMQVQSDFQGLTIVRPLLELSRSRLRATVSKAGASWVDDPTNSDIKYERVRVRKALGILEKEGVSCVDLARSSRRLARARRALQQTASELTQQAVVHEAAGFARILRASFLQAPDEIQLRTLLAVVEIYGGGGERSLAGAEDLLDWMQSETGKARTFAGCRIARRAAEFIVGRECSRISEMPRQLGPGQCAADWDLRYRVSTRRDAGTVELAVLRDVVAAKLPKRPEAVPDFVWQGLPVAIDAENTVHLPFKNRDQGSKSQQNVVFRLIGGPKTYQS